MTVSTSNKFSLEQLYGMLTSTLDAKISLFQGVTLTNISIDKKLSPHKKWQYSFYTGTTKFSSKNYTVQLKISNNIINEYQAKCGTELNNAKFDIEIDLLSISNFGTITITVKSIKETGVSERELLRRKLEQFVKDNSYDKRKKKELPRIITSILALTSKFSDINNDLHSNLNLTQESVMIINCANAKEISQHIKNNTHYDIVVLYRGGREDEAMNMFSNELIIEAIVMSKVPVCVALGHDMDTPFIYTVADKTYSTPSSFSKEIAIHNLKVKEEYNNILYSIGDTLQHIFNKELKYIDYTLENIESTILRIEEKNESLKDLKKEKKKNTILLLITFVFGLLILIAWLL